MSGNGAMYLAILMIISGAVCWRSALEAVNAQEVALVIVANGW
jgi:hypothetical protein